MTWPPFVRQKPNGLLTLDRWFFIDEHESSTLIATSVSNWQHRYTYFWSFLQASKKKNEEKKMTYYCTSSKINPITRHVFFYQRFMYLICIVSCESECIEVYHQQFFQFVSLRCWIFIRNSWKCMGKGVALIKIFSGIHRSEISINMVTSYYFNWIAFS